MNFSPDPELENIRHEARRLADQFNDDYWRTQDEKHEFPWDFYNAFAEQGWIGIIVPEKYGGAGMDFISEAVVFEEVGYADSSVRTTLSVQMSLVELTILQWGSSQQREHYLQLYAQPHPYLQQ